MRTQTAQKTTAALLDMPEVSAAKPRARRNAEVRRAADEALTVRRERPGNGSFYGDEKSEEVSRSRSQKRIRRGLIPKSKYGRIAAGVGLSLFLLGVAMLAYEGVHFLHHDPVFTIPSSAAIELTGNQHLSRAQLLSVFGEDVERNIFEVPLAERQQELQEIPWVEHATIMRLLPNHLQIAVTERTPIAFVRQGGTIGMADASGVLLDIPPDAPGNPGYSFPVVTGLKAADTPESRAQRMHLYQAFLKDLDTGGKKISAELSEVDLSDPEDVRALLPSNNQETLVHFGTDHFLARYNRFQEHIGEWRQQYPRLSSVDMRYERQVVLQMPPKDTPAAGAPSASTGPSAGLDAHKAIGAAASLPSQKPGSGARPVSAATPHVAASPQTRPVPSIAPVMAHADHTTPTKVPKAPAKHPVAESRRHPAKSGTAAQKRAETAKRVEAIKAWMAKRQAARDAARAHAAQ